MACVFCATGWISRLEPLPTRKIRRAMTLSTGRCLLNRARAALEKESTMVVMAGKYIVDVGKSRLILTHPTGISFDLTREDALELGALIDNWQLAMGIGQYRREPEAMQTGKDEN